MPENDLKILKQRLAKLLKKEALKKGEFVLSSGRVSKYYLDGRLVTLSAEGAYLIAKIILALIKGKKIDAIGGPTMGADPIVGAVACLSQIDRCPLGAFIVRKSAKGHGAMRQIEGPVLKKNSRVILVDDVATTGGSLIEAKEILSNQGVEVDCAYVVVDRQEGAEENLKKANLKLLSIFKASDLL